MDNSSVSMVLTIKDIEDIQKRLYEHGVMMAKKKGNDYSGDNEDTFGNIRLAHSLGITDSDPQTCMVRILDKISRMSNYSKPNFVGQIKDESLFDTVSDLWNYASYWLLLMGERKN